MQVNSALHPSGVAKSSTSFGWGKGGKVTSAGWQVTLCDLICHVISRSGVVVSITNCYIRFTLLLQLTGTSRCRRLSSSKVSLSSPVSSTSLRLTCDEDNGDADDSVHVRMITSRNSPSLLIALLEPVAIAVVGSVRWN